MNMRTRTLTATMLVAVLLAACSDADNTNGAAAGDGMSAANGEWELVAGIDLVDGFPVTMTIADDEVTGRAACNSYFGSVSVDASSISISELGQTEMACEPRVMSVESAFLDALSFAESFEMVEGRLVISGGGYELAFAPIAPVPTADLVGTTWILDTLVDGDSATSVMGGPVTLVIRADGSFEGSTGCRSLSGKWIEAGGAIVITEMAAVGDCPDDLAAQDSTIISVLEGDVRVAIDGDALTLTSMGPESLIYKAG